MPKDIPADSPAWDIPVRGAEKLAAALRDGMDLALLFRDLATLRTYDPALSSIEDLRWLGPTDAFVAFSARVEQPQLLQRAQALARRGL